MPKINVLPKFVQNVIASGQVIDRPASVVKELVENSIDAGSTKITIYVKESGLTSIAVVDDGHGIEHDDVRNAFKSFSTSKISSVDDLTEIKTMGFRGEALAAIAAISNVNIWTKTANCDLGTMATFSFGNEEKFEYCASGAHGTKIEVCDLYGNVPNKKRFLKRPSVELSEITNIISRLILANPYIAFKYVIDNNVVLTTMGKGLDEAVFVLYGRNCMENCFRVENEFNDVSVVGLVGGSAYVKPNSTYQTVIVNGRYVKDDTVSIAVKNAFEGLLMTREYPFFVLDITVRPDQIDVNIHPDKMEIKFANKQDVYRAIYSPIKKHFDQERMLSGASSLVNNSSITDISQFATGKKDNSVSVDVQQITMYTNADNSYLPGNKDFGELTQLKFMPIEMEEEDKNKRRDEDEIPASVMTYALDPKTTMTQAQRISEQAENNFYYQTMSNNFSGLKSCNSQTPLFQMVDAIPEITEEEYKEISTTSVEGKDITFSSCRVVGEIFGNYLLLSTQNSGAMIIVDKHAAHERFLYDKYMSNINTGPLMVQSLIIPTTFPLTAEQREFLETIQDVMHGYGFEYEITEKDYLSIKTIPAQFSGMDITFFFNSLFQDHQSNFDLRNINKFYIAKKACKSAIRGGLCISIFDIRFILKKLDENKNLRCPHGRPIAIAIKKRAFDKAFKRIL
ncbi:MAG: DNA mismatch repair endonuclease MutL [Clostridia bacterium]|nr:DNA mismatch repair endonuclease MutL [Clostridia bacterium]